MGIFRRRREETLNEQLLREAGLDRQQQPTPEEAPPWQPPTLDPLTGTYSPGLESRDVARPTEGDAFVTIDAPAIAGDTVVFTTLPDGDLVVDEEQGDADLSPLAEAVEQQLRPPYRATGRRQEGGLWAVAGRAIDVRRFACDLGDDLQLVSRDRELTLEADGVPTAGWIPELQRAGEAAGRDYVVEATRLEGDLWEVRATTL